MPAGDHVECQLDLELASKVRRWVLFSLRTERREAKVRRVLAGSPGPAADDVMCGRMPVANGGLDAVGWPK